MFYRYRKYDVDNQRHEKGFPDRRFAIPYGDAVIQVCQERMKFDRFASPMRRRQFDADDVLIQESDGKCSRVDAAQPGKPAVKMIPPR